MAYVDENFEKHILKLACVKTSPAQLLPVDHGLAVYVSNAAKTAARAAVRQYVKNIAAADGHPLPVRMRCGYRRYTDDMDRTEEIIVLPPRYTKYSLHKEYIMYLTDVNLRVRLETFIDLLEMNMPFVRVSLRTRGL